MHKVEPQVFLIGETRVVEEGSSGISQLSWDS